MRERERERERERAKFHPSPKTNFCRKIKRDGLPGYRLNWRPSLQSHIVQPLFKAVAHEGLILINILHGSTSDGIDFIFPLPLPFACLSRNSNQIPFPIPLLYNVLCINCTYLHWRGLPPSFSLSLSLFLM